jgi:outer membrane protein TolC
MRKTFLFFSVFLLSALHGYTQQSLKLSLDETIHLAQKNSLDYKIIVNMAQSSYWNYENYKAGFLPRLSLSGNLPDYFRSINSITLPDGQINFVGQNVANTSLYLNLSQNIGLTGGNISLGSSLSRLDNFGNFNNTSYTSVPFTLSYNQGNLFYNDFSWQKKIQPLKLLEAQRTYLENLENISYNTVSQYFDLLLAYTQLRLDQQNLRNIDTLVKITQARYEIGTAQLNDVLQTKVSLLDAKTSMANSTLSLQNAHQNLIRFLNLDRSTKVELTIPDSLLFFEITPEIALEKAQKSREYIIEFKRRRLEAEQAIARTKAETGPQINIRANIGSTQTGSTIGQAYNTLLTTQALTIGFNIPIIDWGVNKSNRKRAEANLAMELNQIAQGELSAEQELYYQVAKWDMQQQQIEIAKSARDLAEQRYKIARQKYVLGSLSFTDFNNAQFGRDRAVTDYISNLRNYWSMFYLLRRLTLYDFSANKTIEPRDINIQ